MSSSTTNAAHKHPKVRAWLDRHERFVFHFTPTSCSWLNAVEGFFARLSRRRLKRGVFRSVVDLQAAINRFLAETNAEPKPRRTFPGPSKRYQNPPKHGNIRPMRLLRPRNQPLLRRTKILATCEG